MSEKNPNNILNAYEKLKKDGHNCVDNLMKCIKDSHIIEDTVEAENEAKKLFDQVKDKADVGVEKFNEVVTKLAEDNKKTIDQVTSMLLAAVPRLQNAIVSAANAAAAAAEEALKKI